MNYILTSFSSSRWASRTFKIMSSVNPWKLEIKDSCLSISVRTPNTRALVDPISSERFSSNSLKTSLKNFKNSDCMWNQFHGKNYVKNRSYIYTTYLNFSLIIEQFPSLVNLISWVIEERLSLDLDWVLTFWSSSMMSWICLRTISSPISIYIHFRIKYKYDFDTVIYCFD